MLLPHQRQRPPDGLAGRIHEHSLRNWGELGHNRQVGNESQKRRQNGAKPKEKGPFLAPSGWGKGDLNPHVLRHMIQGDVVQGDVGGVSNLADNPTNRNAQGDCQFLDRANPEVRSLAALYLGNKRLIYLRMVRQLTLRPLPGLTQPLNRRAVYVLSCHHVCQYTKYTYDIRQTRPKSNRLLF